MKQECHWWHQWVNFEQSFQRRRAKCVWEKGEGESEREGVSVPPKRPSFVSVGKWRNTATRVRGKEGGGILHHQFWAGCPQFLHTYGPGMNTAL